MKFWMFAAVSMLASTACSADETLRPVPVPNRLQPSEISPEERKQILQEKTAQLRRLQDEILKLNGSISHPTRVRTTIRVIEIDGIKLKKQKLSDPFQADDAEADGPATAKHVTFDNDRAVLRALEPLVTSGCAKVLASPTLITPVGETSIVNCYREFPNTDESMAENKITDIQGGSRQVPGYRVIVHVVVDPAGELLVTAGCRADFENPASAVKLNGQLKMGMNSCAVQSTQKLKSGIPSIFGGTTTTSIPAVATSESKRWAVVPAALKPKAIETGERIRKTYFQVTCERLPDENIDAVSPR